MNNQNNQGEGGEDELVLGSAPHGGAPEVDPPAAEPAADPVPQDPDAVTATRKFNWLDRENETTRTFYPGAVIDIPEAADWALDQEHGEQRGLQSPARSHNLNAPENKARDLALEGENKGGKPKTKKR